MLKHHLGCAVLKFSPAIFCGLWPHHCSAYSHVQAAGDHRVACVGPQGQGEVQAASTLPQIHCLQGGPGTQA